MEMGRHGMDKVVATAPDAVAGVPDGASPAVGNDGLARSVRPDDPSIPDPRGGAIALGRPPGASGALLAGTVGHPLARRGSGTGVATLRIGVGQGRALVLDR